MSQRPALCTTCSALACCMMAMALAVAAFERPQPEPMTGLDPDAISEIDRLVRSFVDDEEIVGAEILIVQGGEPVLREAYGWRDREAELPMEAGSVFCVRSMTKPVIAALMLTLIDDGLLSPDDHAMQYLPSFDAPGTRDITIRHLLEHSSGLPMSLIASSDLRELEGIKAVADLGGGVDLAFEPGTRFGYSDQGTDTLTAIAEVATGRPAEELVRERVLEPLGMEHSAVVLDDDHPLRARSVSKYVGQTGGWTRFWSPDDPPLFPFFLGSQGLYATLDDYARFLIAWQAESGSPFDPDLAREVLTPSALQKHLPSGFKGIRAEYGSLMQLWIEPEEGSDHGRLVAYGHNGSDGTYAWAFPEHDIVALYFTQSRGNSTGLRFESALNQLVFGTGSEAPGTENNAEHGSIDAYLGYYQPEPDRAYIAIVRDGDRLALEARGRQVLRLVHIEGDRWSSEVNPAMIIEFQRDGHQDVVSLSMEGREMPRFEPHPDLIPADALVARIAETHNLAALDMLGPMRVRSSFAAPRFGITGESTTLVRWPDSFRVESVFGTGREVTTFDGESVMYESATAPAAVLEGDAASAALANSLLARFGDWGTWHDNIRVVQRLRRDEDWVYVVRTGGLEGPATTLFIREDGRVQAAHGMTYAEGIGRIGERVAYSDFRSVEGVLLPHQASLQIANPVAGIIEIESETLNVEFGVEVYDGVFSLR